MLERLNRINVFSEIVELSNKVINNLECGHSHTVLLTAAREIFVFGDNSSVLVCHCSTFITRIVDWDNLGYPMSSQFMYQQI